MQTASSTAKAAPAAAASGPVTVRFGAFTQPVNVAGKSVKEVRAQLGKLWSIPNDATAYVGKEKLTEDTVLQPGQNVEFVRRSGEKG